MRTLSENDKDFFCDITAPCFQFLSQEELELIQTSKIQVVFRKNDQLTKQGAFASYVLFLLKGYAIRYIEDNGERNYNLNIVRPGEFIGLSSVFHRNVFSYSVSAITECQAILIDKEAIASVAALNGKFIFHLARRYCDQNALLYEVIKKIHFKQIQGRLADTLIYLNEIKKEFPEIFSTLNRKEIADFAGISVESAVKLLKTFEKEGLIQLKVKDIEIINREHLVEIARRG